MENLDDLTQLLAGSSVTVAPNSTVREHPRFSQYKYIGRAELSQERRRKEFLRRQKEARFDYANHARKLAMNEMDEDEYNEVEEEMDSTLPDKNSKKINRKRNCNRYADELMLSEWLVDIPDSLSKDWICLPCPVGRRCLVVASNGVTSAYSKSGYLITQFHSYLPGGNHPCHGSYTLLDCIFDAKSRSFYCLDMIAWNSLTVADSDFDCRLFMMNSRITENENFKEVSKQIPYRFICLPYCRCEYDSMKEMMHQDFDFEIDGVLFYHASVHYFKGQSPLVGWLKPWMIPEILSVPIPAKLMNGNEIVAGSSQKFIETYNQEHKHSGLYSVICFRSRIRICRREISSVHFGISKNLHAKVCELEKIVILLKGKLKILKNSRYTAQKENKSLIEQSNQLMEEIRQKTVFTKNSIRFEDEIAFEAEKWSQIWLSENGQKILADKRLLENAQQVKIIERQIEYTQRLIEHKRKIIGTWQNGIAQKVYKDDQLNMLEQENMDIEKKMAEWLKVNQRLLSIFEAMKDREIEMIFATERCKQRNIQAGEECSKMQANILRISRRLDKNSMHNITNTSSTSITLNSQENE
uniref:Snurportin-1 n=1 Tax=Onchocerca volvulus TaxID=6282 RepID=A0A8R1TNC9_ONCVO